MYLNTTMFSSVTTAYLLAISGQIRGDEARMSLIVEIFTSIACFHKRINLQFKASTFSR